MHQPHSSCERADWLVKSAPAMAIMSPNASAASQVVTGRLAREELSCHSSDVIEHSSRFHLKFRQPGSQRALLPQQ